MLREDLQKKVNEIMEQKTNQLNDLVTFMLKKGFSIKKWRNLSHSNDKIMSALEEFFASAEHSVAVGLENENIEKINLNELKELGKLGKNMGNKNLKNKEVNTGKVNGKDELANDEVNEINKPLEEANSTGTNENTVNTVTENTEPTKVTTDEIGVTGEGADNTVITDGNNALKIVENNTEDTNPKTELDDNSKKNETGNTDTDKKDSENKTVDKKETDNKDTTTKKTGKKTGKTTGKLTNVLSTSQIKKIYKTVDNLVSITPSQIITLKNVTKINDEKFSCYIDGLELVQMWEKGRLVFDPTMQRGVKTNKAGVSVATFSDNHVKEIVDSMVKNTFEPTQLRFAIITDEEPEVKYNDSDNSLTVNGKIRLLDGQHRTRAMVLVKNNMNVDKSFPEVDLEGLIYNVEINYCTAERARVIYSLIDKNLKLDKSQVRQLSTNEYSRIVNMLNQDKDSILSSKIATCKPVGKSLVLFSTLYDAIAKRKTINFPSEVNEVANYLKEFFEYATKQLTDALGNDITKRLAWKEKNLLNENNFFHAWIAVAFYDVKNFRSNIDKIVANKDYFNKNNHRWLDLQAVKYKSADKDKPESDRGFAMSNSETAFKNLIEETLKIIK